ncbi:hypothetical protein QBC38DRAFT_446146 [Podospora fimiseda]|uniref:Uncharacterized protein n=1 Tax=Podospora fimiseda TaxID=252190 RepID=A0AAN7GUR7_9PEZI|nr:hypothetical protein QBC38DRAFT_446146 [Podospora fimiseda]
MAPVPWRCSLAMKSVMMSFAAHRSCPNSPGIAMQEFAPNMVFTSPQNDAVNLISVVNQPWLGMTGKYLGGVDLATTRSMDAKPWLLESKGIEDDRRTTQNIKYFEKFDFLDLFSRRSTTLIFPQPTLNTNETTSHIGLGLIRAGVQRTTALSPSWFRRLSCLTHGFKEVQQWKKGQQQRLYPPSSGTRHTIFDLKVCLPINKSASTWNISEDDSEPVSRRSSQHKSHSTTVGGRRQSVGTTPRTQRASMSSSSLLRIDPLRVVLRKLHEEFKDREVKESKKDISEDEIPRSLPLVLGGGPF